MSLSTPLEDLALIRDAALQAGRVALAERDKGLRKWSKDGGSPVTSGDLAVDKWLKSILREARPGYGWLSEETPDSKARLAARRVFVVDPVDGTVAYMKGKPWWCVPIAVIEDGQPVAAVIHAPALDETYDASLGHGARLNGASISASGRADLADAAILCSAALLQGPDWTEPWPPLRFEQRNAIAYRMALVASGAFDAALAFTPKWDWDVCAGALIAGEAGAIVTDHHGQPWRFNQPDPRQASLVCAAPTLHPLIVARTAPIPLAPR